MKSLFQVHVETWKDGCGADICPTVKQRVFARGKLPCDVLFVGEAPGPAEEVLGKPFIGPSGKLLDKLIGQAGLTPYRLAFTNVVCCFPRDEEGKIAAPEKKAIKLCSPRLIDFVTIASPKIIVKVGAVAGKNVPEFEGLLFVTEITHPAFLLRANIAQQGLLVDTCVVKLETVREELEKWQTAQATSS